MDENQLNRFCVSLIALFTICSIIIVCHISFCDAKTDDVDKLDHGSECTLCRLTIIRIDTSTSDENLVVTILGSQYEKCVHLNSRNDAVIALMFEIGLNASDD